MNSSVRRGGDFCYTEHYCPAELPAVAAEPFVPGLVLYSFIHVIFSVPFLGGSDGKESACNAGSSVSGLGRSRGEGNGYPLQDSCLETSMEPGGLQSMGLQRVGPN